uniref:Uncharacterized protein n=1 Tax=Phocoena sinus TaxID=42100 RepID=A0A8C9CK57_PHOSS
MRCTEDPSPGASEALGFANTPHLAQKPQPGRQGTAGLSSSRGVPGAVGAPPLWRPYSWDRCWWEGRGGDLPLPCCARGRGAWCRRRFRPCLLGLPGALGC